MNLSILKTAAHTYPKMFYVFVVIFCFLSLIFIQQQCALSKALILTEQGLMNGSGNIYKNVLPPETSSTLIDATDIRGWDRILLSKRYFEREPEDSDKFVEWRNTHLWQFNGAINNYIAVTSGALLEYNALTGKESLIYQWNHVKFSFSCRWSTDASLIACYQDNALEIIDAHSHRQIAQKNLEDGVEIFRWIGNDAIALYLGAGKTNNIQRFSVSQNSISPICSYYPFFQGGIEDGYYEDENRECIKTPEFATLFGGSQWPARYILISSEKPDDRFYIYDRGKPGGGLYPGKKWIEAYDRWTHTTSRIYTTESLLTRFVDNDSLLVWLFSRTAF